MSSPKLLALLEECEGELGEAKLVDVLESLLETAATHSTVLTIVANAGVHHLPEHLLRGHVHFLSEGSLDFSSKESVVAEFEHCLKQLAGLLKSESWKAIYLIPFGPTLLSALVKLVVFRVTGMETVDVMHLGNGKYVDLDINVRGLILASDEI